MEYVKGLSEQGSVGPLLQGNKAGLQEEDSVQGHLYTQELPVASTVLEEVTYVQPRIVILVFTPRLFTGTSDLIAVVLLI